MAKGRSSGATQATRALHAAGVEFTEHPYAHDPAAESYGLEAASALGLDPASVFKTLVTEVERVGLVVAIVPVAARLDLPALAAAAGGKRAALADVSDAERRTGYVAGGISPIGQRRALPTVVDASALGQPKVYVSGGRRGFDIGLAPDDLIAVTGASVAPIARAD